MAALLEEVRYQKRVGPSGPDNPYSWIRNRIAAGSCVLDVGCGSGEIGAYLRESGMSVDGIEPDPDRARLASERLRAVHVGLAGDDIATSGLRRSYDAILFLDVLEHAAEPAQ